MRDDGFGRVIETRVWLSTVEREALMAARRDAGLSRKLLAQRLGVSWYTICKWQTGERRPTSEQLRAWWSELTK